MRELLDYTSASHPKGQTMTDKTRNAFEVWIRASKSWKDNKTLFDRHESGLYELNTVQIVFDAFQAATFFERERCANLIEKMTAHRRMVRAAINGVKPEGCEYAAAIRQGGDA